jgi:hypothetical protein
MRKIYLLSILGSIGISACGGEDDPPGPGPSAGGNTATGGTGTGGTSTGGTSTGGVKATGGVPATGGTSTGGTSGGSGGAKGGSGGSGGFATTGGSGGKATGGAGGSMGGSKSTGGAGGSMGGGKATGGAGGSMGGVAGGGTGGAGTATFKAVSDIIAKSCAACHDGSKHSDLRATGLYERLMSPPKSTSGVDADCKAAFVVPNMPEKSLLVAIVGADDGPRAGCAVRMPYMCGKNGTDCLTDAAVQTIRDWISAGAPQ